MVRSLILLLSAVLTATALKVQPTSLANQLQLLSRQRVHKGKQEPTDGGVAPAEVDAAAYEEDWGDEFHNGQYPESSKGLQHHPDNSVPKVKSNDNYWLW